MNQDIRCPNCHRKLAASTYRRLQIKCPRCGVVNEFNEYPNDPERPDRQTQEPPDASDPRNQEPPRMGGR